MTAIDTTGTPADAPEPVSATRRFFDRYLPRTERRTALWLAVGGGVVSLIALEVEGRVWDAVFVGSDVGAMPSWGPYLIAALVQFAIVAILVAALVRFARAPKVLALYLTLGAAVSVALVVVGLPLSYLSARFPPTQFGLPVPVETTGWWISSAARLAEHLAMGLGATAGAWIAATVSLARMRDVGFSGDAPDGDGLRSKPDPMGWSFMGWEGRPVVGASLIALAFVTTEALLGIVSFVLEALSIAVPGQFGGGTVGNAYLVGYAALLAIGWLFAARAVTLRTGVVSLWVIPLGGLIGSVAWVAESLVSMYQAYAGVQFSAEMLAEASGIVGANLGGPLIMMVAALAGTALALAREPATLSADEPHHPTTAEAPTTPQETNDE